jgi:hypothetical protein
MPRARETFVNSSLAGKVILETYERMVKDEIYDSGLGRRQTIGRGYNQSKPMTKYELKAVLAEKQKNPDQLLDYWVYELVEVPKKALDV